MEDVFMAWQAKDPAFADRVRTSFVHGACQRRMS